MDPKTITDVNAVEKDLSSPIAGLFQLGREKSYVTYDDILQYSQWAYSGAINPSKYQG